MKFTEFEKKQFSKKPIKTVGSYKLPLDADYYGRTKHCRCPETTDWTKPCPICKRRVRI